MKRDPQHPVSFVNGILTAPFPVEQIFKSRQKPGYRVAISLESGKTDGICHGVKRMPVERVRKDGVVVGQVYLFGRQWKGVVTYGALTDGTAVSFTLAVIEPLKSRGLVAPFSRGDRAAYLAAGFDGLIDADRWRKKLGWSDLRAAEALRDAVLVHWRFPGRDDGCEGIEFPYEV